MNRVKICGITRREDALKAAQLGAWAIGFIFYKKSPRFIGPFKAQKIIASLPPLVTPVGVFVNQKEGAVKDILEFCGINTVQFHGDETPVYCQRFKKYKVIKALRVADALDLEELKKYKTSAFLFDTYQKDAYGGTGKSCNWSVVKGCKNLGVPIILSGGLNPRNIYAAIDEVTPFAVDISSGVEESPGKKSSRLLTDLFQNLP